MFEEEKQWDWNPVTGVEVNREGSDVFTVESPTRVDVGANAGPCHTCCSCYACRGSTFCCRAREFCYHGSKFKRHSSGAAGSSATPTPGPISSSSSEGPQGLLDL